MAADVSDIAVAVGPLWVVDKRLEHHAASGQFLEGIIYDREGKTDITGRANLPCVQPIIVTDQEGWAPGGGGGLGSHISTRILLSLLVSAKREYGLFDRDPTATYTGDDANYYGTGVFDWVMKVRDAIEKTTAAVPLVDPFLEGTVSKPVLTAIRDAPAFDLSWSMVLELQIDIESICRGARSVAP